MPAKSDHSKSRINEQNIFYYNKIAGDYNAFLDKDDSNKLARQAMSNKFKTHVEGGTVLDFGGGTGLDLGWLSNEQYHIIFCEPSVQMKEKAIQYNESIIQNNAIIFLDGSHTDFRNWNRALPFPQPVDAVLANFAVLNCIPDIDLLFKNLALIVKPGGHIFALILNNRFGKLLKTHFRSVIKSLVLHQPISFQVNFNQFRQTVYIHSAMSIKKVSAPYFYFCKQETIANSGFVLIHLSRK